MTTCPSGVNYMHLVDHARSYIEQTYRRPWPDRALRALLGGGAATTRAVSRGTARRARDAAIGANTSRLRPNWPAPARDAGTDARHGAVAQRRLPPRRSTGARRTPGPCGVVGRLRPAGARTRDQCRDDPPVDAARRRGSGGARRRLLRRADPPYGAARRGHDECACEHRRVEPRDRRRGARCGRDQCLRLRHHGEGLRVHVPVRAGTMARPGRRISELACDISELLARSGYAPTRTAPA